ncbi:MAG: ABC transporter ATP-binding protein [Chloroflexota bacterium]
MKVSIQNVTKTYRGGVQALIGISIELGAGMFGLLGPNGAGKTTLMRIMATLLPPSSGDILVNDISIHEAPNEIRKVLGYLPQNFSMYPQLTVYEFLDYFTLLSGMSGQRRERIHGALERTNLLEQSNTRTGKLSGGMKKRLGIAQALINDPLLLIVDEPTAGLDPAERVRFRNLLATISGERTVILSTHIVEDVASACADLAVLSRGEILMRGTPSGLAAKASGKVWTLTVSQAQLDQLQTRAHIVSAVRQDDVWQVRALSDAAPSPSAVPAEATIEDGYLYLMEDEVGR